jgi:predicted nucleic acid-binding protein
MALPTRLPEPAAVLVADASVAINLNATGCAAEIIGALSERVVIVDAVFDELEGGREKGRRDAECMQQLVAQRLVQIDRLSLIGLRHMEGLVVGSATETLDDGEASTIAYAAEINALAVIDERKAIRLCRERFPQLRLGSTVDILARPELERALGRARLADAVFNALQIARMRVLPERLQWVVHLIGVARASRCLSLPRSGRNIRPPR